MNVKTGIVSMSETPNADAYKIELTHHLLRGGGAEFYEGGVTGIRLVDALLAIEGVASVFIAHNFLTVLKKSTELWDELLPQIREEFMKCWEQTEWTKLFEFAIFPMAEHEEVSSWINSNILPATFQDGGGIFLENLSTEEIHVRVMGACTTCPYLPRTLEEGILKPAHQMNSKIRSIAVN